MHGGGRVCHKGRGGSLQPHRVRGVRCCLALCAFSLLFASLAQAAAAETVHVTIAGSGHGEVSSVGGVGAFESENHEITEELEGFGSIYEGAPAIACSGPPPTGTCETALVEDVEGIKSIGLHAVPAPGSEFAGWTITGTASSPQIGCEEGAPYSETEANPRFCLPAGESADLEVTATFTEQVVHVTIAGSGHGEVSSVGGVGAFESENHEITEELEGFGSIYEGAPAIACSGPPPTGTCETALVEDVEGIKSIGLHAVPAPGSEFAGWTITGTASSPQIGCEEGAPYSETEANPRFCLPAGESADLEVTATFTEQVVHVTIAGSGHGEVSSVGGVGAFESENHEITEELEGFGSIYEGAPAIACSGPPPTGTCETALVEDVEGIKSIGLHAVPAPGSEFAGWTITGTASSPQIGCEEGAPYSETEANPRFCLPAGESADLEVTATFIASLSHLTIDTTGGTGTGQVNCEVNGGERTDEPCAEEYPQGTELKLIPEPGTHAEFGGFENGTGSAESCTGTGSCTITLNEDSEIDAPFNLITHTLTVTPTGNGKVNAAEPPSPVSGGISECEESAGTCVATYNAGVPSN